MTFTFDSNIISYLLRGEGETLKNFESNIIDGNNCYTIGGIITGAKYEK